MSTLYDLERALTEHGKECYALQAENRQLREVVRQLLLALPPGMDGWDVTVYARDVLASVQEPTP